VLLKLWVFRDRLCRAFSFLKCQVTVIIRLLPSFRMASCPLPSNFTFHSKIFRLSDRCIRLRLPFGFSTFVQLRGRSVLSFRHLCRNFNFGLSSHSEEWFSIYNSIWSFDFLKLSLKTQPTTSTIYWISFLCKHSMNCAQNIFRRRYFDW
jgi:hypothetical protein